MSNENGGSGDFLLVTDDGPFRRHRPLVITVIVVVAVLLALIGWELIEGGWGSNASGAAASLSSPAVPGLRSSAGPASPSLTRPSPSPSPATVTRTVTRTVPGPRVLVTVTATVSAAGTAIVPDVFKLTLAEATEVMRSLGFAVAPNATTAPPGDDGSQTVVSQSPDQGTAVAPGATVTLTYYGSS